MGGRYLITGGAGFIGSNLAHRLVKEGHRPVIIDDLSTGRLSNLDDISSKIDFIEGSILDEALLDKAMDGVEFVLHQAALPSVQRSMEAPMDSHQVNTKGTLQVFLAAAQHKVKRVAYAASSSAYGNIETLPKVEDMTPEPVSVYAITKLVGEYYARVMTESFGVEVIALRYFNVFGPRQNPASQYAAVIPKFITALLAGQSPTIFGDGTQSRDFCYIDNVVNANLLALKAPSTAAGKVYNIACGTRIDLNELVEELNGIIGTSVKPVYEPERAGDVKHSLADISRAEKYLGYQVSVNMNEGLRRTVDWFKNQ